MKSEKRINVILTLRICEPHLNISEFENFEIINCYEVLEKYNYDLLKDSNIKRIEYVVDKILNSKTNVLICDTNFEILDFHKIIEMLEPNKLNIDKILVPNETKRNEWLAEGQETYKNHSRWMDVRPGQLEEIYEEFEYKIKKLKSRYENTETKIVEI